MGAPRSYTEVDQIADPALRAEAQEQLNALGQTLPDNKIALKVLPVSGGDLLTIHSLEWRANGSRNTTFRFVNELDNQVVVMTDGRGGPVSYRIQSGNAVSVASMNNASGGTWRFHYSIDGAPKQYFDMVMGAE